MRTASMLAPLAAPVLLSGCAAGDTSPSAAADELSPSTAADELSPSTTTGELSPSTTTGELSPPATAGEIGPSATATSTSSPTATPSPTLSPTPAALATPPVPLCEHRRVMALLTALGKATQRKVFDPGPAVTAWASTLRAAQKLPAEPATGAAARRTLRAIAAYQAIPSGTVAARNRARAIAQAALTLADACRTSYGIVVPPLAKAPKPRPVAPVQSNDRRYSTCAEANAHGLGPYRRGLDPEYAWYQDRDGDGRVCEPG
ncbi:excalibur calcium-binding domain-containing protein [Nonomuraea sp. NPDC050328]|uniref:excalibur calcium-binding domain-containing protein n=1 Tax=Nonomuraea sp. NPDC050328 TaxID=3364361 RepID=UPI0037A0CCC1